MFYWEAVHPPQVDGYPCTNSVFRMVDDKTDFDMCPQTKLVHQAHLNAFVPPASTDWHAYEWQEGDFAKHFAGCPWQEQPCLSMIEQTVGNSTLQYRAVMDSLGRASEVGDGADRLPLSDDILNNLHASSENRFSRVWGKAEL